jgi:hypothetical protein
MRVASDAGQQDDSDHGESDRDREDGQQPVHRTSSWTDTIACEALRGLTQLAL